MADPPRSKAVTDQVWELINAALSDKDAQRAGQTALRALRAIKAGSVLLTVPTGQKNTFPGLRTGRSGWKFKANYSGPCSQGCGNRIEQGEEVYCLQEGNQRTVMCLECAYEKKYIDE